MNSPPRKIPKLNQNTLTQMWNNEDDNITDKPQHNITTQIWKTTGEEIEEELSEDDNVFIGPTKEIIEPPRSTIQIMRPIPSTVEAIEFWDLKSILGDESDNEDIYVDPDTLAQITDFYVGQAPETTDEIVKKKLDDYVVESYLRCKLTE